MKKSSISLAMMIAITSPIVLAQPKDVIIIDNCIGLQNIKDDLTADYELRTDIDCMPGLPDAPAKFTTIGNVNNPFTGTLNGNGFSIKNLHSTTQGLFGATYGAEISDLHLEDIDINTTTSSNIGAISSDDISGSNGSTFIRVGVTGTIEIPTRGNGSNIIGGIIGTGTRITVEESYANVDITVTSIVQKQTIGGLIGDLLSGTVQNSYAAGSIRTTGGGITVSGLIANSTISTVQNSYAAGKITGSGYADVGGLITTGGGNKVTSSYWDTETTGTRTSVGGGEGKTTDEMCHQDTYVDWSFCDPRNPSADCIWDIDNGSTLPRLHNNLETSRILNCDNT